METIIRDVKAIETADRQAIEHVIGRPLAEDQKLVIQILGADLSSTGSAKVAVALPDWCNVYEGLSDDEVSALEQVVLTRADLSRGSD